MGSAVHFSYAQVRDQVRRGICAPDLSGLFWIPTRLRLEAKDGGGLEKLYIFCSSFGSILDACGLHF